MKIVPPIITYLPYCNYFHHDDNNADSFGTYCPTDGFCDVGYYALAHHQTLILSDWEDKYNQSGL